MSLSVISPRNRSRGWIVLWDHPKYPAMSTAIATLREIIRIFSLICLLNEPFPVLCFLIGETDESERAGGRMPYGVVRTKGTRR